MYISSSFLEQLCALEDQNFSALKHTVLTNMTIDDYQYISPPRYRCVSESGLGEFRRIQNLHPWLVFNFHQIFGVIAASTRRTTASADPPATAPTVHATNERCDCVGEAGHCQVVTMGGTPPMVHIE